MHFEKLSFTCGRYSISHNDGTLKDNVTGELIRPTKDPVSNEQYFYGIPGLCDHDPNNRVQAGFLILLSIYNITIPRELWHRLKSKPINTVTCDVRSNNLYFDYTNGPIECVWYPGYYYVPEYKYILVTAEGSVLSYAGDVITGKQGTLNFAGKYLEVSAIRADGVSRTCKTHVLTALAHCQRPGNPFGLTVNHIDTNRQNNHSSNLEFVNRSVNAIHYNLMQGGYGPVIDILCNGSLIKSCSTPLEASAVTGAPLYEVWNLIRNPSQRTVNGFNIGCRLQVDISDSTALNQQTVERLPTETIYCLDTVTNQITTYDNPSQLAKALNSNDNGVRVMLTRPIGTMYMGRYILKYESSEWPTQAEVDAARRTNEPKKVLVRDEQTLVVSEYPSAGQAIALTGDSKKVVTVSLKRNDRRLINGKRYMYKPSDDMSIKWHIGL